MSNGECRYCHDTVPPGTECCCPGAEEISYLSSEVERLRKGLEKFVSDDPMLQWDQMRNLAHQLLRGEESQPGQVRITLQCGGHQFFSLMTFAPGSDDEERARQVMLSAVIAWRGLLAKMGLRRRR